MFSSVNCRVLPCHESIFTKTLGLENTFNAFSISLSLFSSSIFLCFIRSVSQLTGRELSSVVISFCSTKREIRRYRDAGHGSKRGHLQGVNVVCGRTSSSSKRLNI